MIWLIEICHTDYRECSLVDFVLESTEATDYQVFTWEVRRHTHIMHLQNYWQVGKINFHFCTHLPWSKLSNPTAGCGQALQLTWIQKALKCWEILVLKFFVLPFSELLRKERNSKGIFLCLLNKKQTLLIRHCQIFWDEVDSGSVGWGHNSSLESSSSLTNTVLIPISSPT